MKQKIIRQSKIFNDYTLMIVCVMPDIPFADDGRYNLDVKVNATGDIITIEKEIGLMKADTKFDCIVTASKY